MNPLRIAAETYRTFERLELDLPAGCVAVVGDNGAGKSSIVNVIDLCLFGPDGRSLAPYLTEGGDTELMLELEFEHRGERYRVRRGFSARGRGKTTLDLEQLVESRTENGHGLNASTATARSWEPLTRGSVRETDEALVDLLGFTRNTFRASAFLAQGDGAAFPEADPRQRKQLLADVLGLSRYDTLLQAVRRDRRSLDDELQRIAGRLEQSDAELAQRDTVESALQLAEQTAADVAGLLRDSEARVGELAAAARELERRQAELRAVQADRGRAEDQVRVAREHVDEAAEAARQAQVAADELASLPTAGQVALLEQREAELAGRLAGFQQAVQAYELARREHEMKLLQRNAIAGQASELNENAHALRERAAGLEARGPGGEHCELCGQTLGAEALASTVAQLRHQADELDAAARDLDAQASAIALPEVPAKPEMPLADDQPVGVDAALDSVRGALRRAREGELQRSRLEERIAALAKTAELRGARERALADAEAAYQQAESQASMLEDAFDAGELDRITAAAVQEQARLADLRRQADAAAANRTRLQTQRDRLADLADRAAADVARRDQLHEQADLLGFLERAYGRDGIPALIVSASALPQLETEACRILSELGTSYRVELRTERELKGGGQADALDVVVVTEQGARPYETFSGGERTRINLALRIALARLLAHRRGAESRLIAIDEPEFLDEAGTAALAGVLRDLHRRGDFDRVMLVSHVPALRDAFDSAIAVAKDGDRSTVAAA